MKCTFNLTLHRKPVFVTALRVSCQRCFLRTRIIWKLSSSETFSFSNRLSTVSNDSLKQKRLEIYFRGKLCKRERSFNLYIYKLYCNNSSAIRHFREKWGLWQHLLTPGTVQDKLARVKRTFHFGYRTFRSRLSNLPWQIEIWLPGSLDLALQAIRP